MENMRFKAGDRVRIKSLDWYNENKDDYGSIYAGNGFCFWKNMARHCGEIMKITSVKVDPEDSNKGYYFMENSEERWTDEMIEGLVTTNEPVFKPSNISLEKEMEWNLPEGYQFKDENGNVINATKIVLEKKEYPKTYEECLAMTSYDKEERLLYLLDKFKQLLICRDAYWKIAGDEMGLGKPWKNGRCEVVYGICRDEGNIVKRDDYWGDTYIFEFPIREMRDAFRDNFGPDIEICKELL